MSKWYVLALGALLGACASAPVKSTMDKPLTQPEVAEALACDLPVDGPWPVFQGNAARTGNAPVPAIETPQIRWKAQVGIQSWLNNPVIAAGRVFVGSNGNIWNQPDPGDVVSALDLKTGEILWQSSFDNDVNGVAYSDCKVYATSDDGTVRAFDARDGKLLWTHFTSATNAPKVYTNPLVLGRLLVVGDADGTLWALDTQSGKVRWTHAALSAIRGGASADKTHIYIATHDGLISAIDPATGAQVWRDRTLEGWQLYGAPTLWGGRVFQGFARDTTYGSPAMMALNAEKGRVDWHALPKTGKNSWANIRSSPALAGNLLIWGEPYSSDVVAVSADTGDVVWDRSFGDCFFQHFSSPAVASGTGYIGRFDGGLYAFDTQSGDLRWGMDLSESKYAGPIDAERTGLDSGCEWEPSPGSPIYASPAIAEDGTIVVGTGEGWLYAISE